LNSPIHQVVRSRMPKYTRGEFLGFGAVLAGAFGISRAPVEQTEQPSTATAPDLIVVNANIYTIEASQPRAEAFAVKNGRFVAVGSTSDVRNLVTGRTPVVDAQRMTIVPGFVDAHSHPSGVDELY